MRERERNKRVRERRREREEMVEGEREFVLYDLSCNNQTVTPHLCI